MNQGESAEIKFIAFLGCHVGKSIRFSNAPTEIFISSIEIPIKGTQEKLQLPKFDSNVTPDLICSMSKSDFNSFCESVNIIKSGPFSKSDVYINSKGYSLKSVGNGPPAIVNHTNRLGWNYVARRIKNSMIELDNLIDEYWDRRLAGIIKEDVLNTNINSPFSNNSEILKPFLNYFCFDGSGKKDSDHPADFIIKFTNPFDFTTWEIFDRENYIDHHWSELCFSVRSKGMNKIQRLSIDEQTSVLKWARDFQGSLKGSLHVRVK
jgi:hypothetical protein